ncbi:MAG: transposase [Candidatus Solibacter sp.]|nr:transposase [Candidatus Solibacter sp.]
MRRANSCSDRHVRRSPRRCAHEDYEYGRAGTRNLFVAVEPRGKRRFVEVTARRTKVDFVAFVKNLLEEVYATALTVHLVLDNLNTHFRQTFVDVLGETAAAAPASAVSLHAQACQRVEHGGDRNRDQGPAMHRTTHRHGGTVTSRGEAVAAATQRCRTRHRMEIHTPRRGPQTMPSLCFVIKWSYY